MQKPTQKSYEKMLEKHMASAAEFVDTATRAARRKGNNDKSKSL
jgi:hypothetical protein